MKKLLLLSACVVMMSSAALIPALNPVDLALGVGGSQIVLEGSGDTAYSYSYTATLNEQAKFNGGDPGNEYFVLHDFGRAGDFLGLRGVVPGPASAWNVSMSNIGFPPGITSDNGGPVDDPTLENLLFQYVGNGTTGPQSWTFDVLSRVGPGFVLANFTSSAANAQLANSFVRNWGEVLVPGPRSDDNPIPEPLTIGLLGAGLASIGLMRRFRN